MVDLRATSWSSWLWLLARSYGTSEHPGPRTENLAASFTHESTGLDSRFHVLFSHRKPSSACTETAAALFTYQVRAAQCLGLRRRLCRYAPDFAGTKMLLL